MGNLARGIACANCAATNGEQKPLLAAKLLATGVITSHNLRARSSCERNWVEVHVPVDPELTVKQAHEVTTKMESAARDELGPKRRLSCMSNRQNSPTLDWSPFLAMKLS